MPSSSREDAERVIRLFAVEPNPGARPARVRACFGESMSLYRAGLKLAFFLPLGVAIPLLESGFADVSSVFVQPSRADATL